MDILLSLFLNPPPSHFQNPVSKICTSLCLVNTKPTGYSIIRKRQLVLKTILLCSGLTPQLAVGTSFAEYPESSKSLLSGLANTKSWFQFYGDGFAIRVPPDFENLTQPEDYNAGLSYYGDKAKPKTFGARFASSDGLETVSVIIRPSNQLKITFLEAKDISDLGSLKDAAKIFVPGGAIIYSARTIKVKEDEGFQTYYFYEFRRDEQHVALVATLSGGKAFVAGATAPLSRWDEDGAKLRSAALSLTIF